LHLVPQRERDAERFAILKVATPGPIVSSDVVVDALLGTGSTRPMEGPIAEAVDAVRDSRVYALDLPSGVNSDTGAADPKTLTAFMTITLGLAKAGLYQYPARELCGDIVVEDIGIPAALTGGAQTWLGDAELARGFLPERPESGHKGTFGKLLVLAGCASYSGAPYLTSVAAARAGAGLVRIATPLSVQPIVATKFTEATFALLPETADGTVSREALPRLEALLTDDFDCLLIGPGLSQDWETRDVVEQQLLGGRKMPPRVVIDADGLNNIAIHPDWPSRLPKGCVLTPHPAEFGRLANLSIHEVLANRFEVARDKAREWGQIVVAKGANTIIAGPDGRTVIDPGANPLVGTAGTGDVLAGTIAGLLTQGCEPWEGAVAATRVCSIAAQQLRAVYGRSGMLASDLHGQIPLAMKEIRGG
jgi:NAD(P)H-hydrate epimerase